MSEFLVIVLSVLVVYLTICILVQKKIITLLKNKVEEYSAKGCLTLLDKELDNLIKQDEGDNDKR